MSRGDVVNGSVALAAVIAVPASLLTVVLTIAASPLTPLGVARRAEPDLGFFVDVPVVAAVALGVLVGVLAIAGAVPLVHQTERSISPPLRAAAAVTGNLGPAARVGLTLARGSWPRTAAVVTGAALTALVASSMLVTSLDRVVDEQHRHGAWWDLAMGDYSDLNAIARGAEIVAEDPDVEAHHLAGVRNPRPRARDDGASPSARPRHPQRDGSAAAYDVQRHGLVDGLPHDRRHSGRSHRRLRGRTALWDALARGVAVPSGAVRPLFVPVLAVGATMVVSQAVTWIAT